MSTRIPQEVRDAIIRRDEARRALKVAEADFIRVLAPFTGATFFVEGVPVKVCGAGKRLYVRRIVGAEEANRLRRKWREER